MNPANFGEISFSSFGNPEVQSYSLPIDNAHRAYNSVPTTVGTCDNDPLCEISDGFISKVQQIETYLLCDVENSANNEIN